MSQREKAGLSWPEFAVAAGKPFDVVPEADCAATYSEFVQPFRLASFSADFGSFPPPPRGKDVGVGQPASAAAAGNRSIPCDGPPFGLSWLHGVGQPASCAVVRRSIPPSPCLPGPVISVRGVGHPVRSVSEVRRADARSRENDRPAGVTCSFQVSENKVEPRPSSRSLNLLAKDRARAMLADESEPLGPQVTFVSETAALSGARERLTGTGAGPDFAITGPAGEGEGEWPAANAGEEMTGFSDGNVEGSNIDN